MPRMRCCCGEGALRPLRRCASPSLPGRLWVSRPICCRAVKSLSPKSDLGNLAGRPAVMGTVYGCVSGNNESACIIAPSGGSPPERQKQPTRLAVVDIDKLWNYCLNHEHRRGCHKARVFAASLGMARDHAEDLRNALLAAALANDAKPLERDEYGRRYVVDLRQRDHPERQWFEAAGSFFVEKSFRD